MWRFHTGSAAPDPNYKVVTNSEDAVVLDFGGNYLLTKTNDVQSAVVYSDELPPAITSIVTKSYVENLGIKSGIQSEDDPVWSEDKPNYATKTALESAADLARARHDYRWAAKQGVLYRIDFDADGYQYLTPVTNVNALAEGNEHILIHLEEQRHGNAD